MKRLLVLPLVLTLLGTAAAADDYPNRPITMVVAFGPGGSTDRMARAMSVRLGKALGQPVQVVNRKGAGTLLAANHVLAQAHDGYTVLASSFSPYLANLVLEGNADFAIDDFAYLNLQWFDEDLIAANRNASFGTMREMLAAIRNQPKTVKGAVVRGSGGHLIARMLLERCGIPQDYLNLVTYNGGGLARAAAAGHVVDFIVVSAEGTVSIRDYLTPLAIASRVRNPAWHAPTLPEAMQGTGCEMPVLPGTIRGYATTAEFQRRHPARFDKLVAALRETLQDPKMVETLEQAKIGRRWIGPEASLSTMQETFEIFKDYSYLLKAR